MTRKRRSHVRILIYRTFAIGSWDSFYISINNWKRILRLFNLKYTKLNCTSKITSGLKIRGQTKQSSSVNFTVKLESLIKHRGTFWIHVCIGWEFLNYKLLVLYLVIVIHFYWTGKLTFLALSVRLHSVEKIPSVQSLVETSSLPNIWGAVMAYNRKQKLQEKSLSRYVMLRNWGGLLN